MRYSHDPFTDKEIIAIVDLWLLTEGSISQRDHYQALVRDFIDQFGDYANYPNTIPPCCRDFAPEFPVRPKPVLSTKTKEQIRTLEYEWRHLFYRPLSCRIKQRLDQIRFEICQLEKGELQ